jgi:hypothetical protein
MSNFPKLNDLASVRYRHVILTIVFIIIVFIMLHNSIFNNFIINTILGRTIMVFWLIFMTYYNIGLGLAATLIVVALHSASVIEGMDNITESPKVVGIDKEAVIPTPDTIGTPIPAPLTATTTTSKDKTKTTTPSEIPASPPSNDQSSSISSSSNVKEGFDGFSSKVRNTGVDRISAEKYIRSKPSKSLFIPYNHNKSEPSPNWPDKDGYTTLYAPIVVNQQYI